MTYKKTKKNILFLLVLGHVRNVNEKRRAPRNAKRLSLVKKLDYPQGVSEDRSLYNPNSIVLGVVLVSEEWSIFILMNVMEYQTTWVQICEGSE